MQAERDENYVPTLLAVSSVDNVTPVTLYANPTTHRLLVNLASGDGTVTDVSVVTANGFAGTVANSTTTPAITLSTTVTGIIKGNGTAISAAVAGTDYADATFKTIVVSGQSDIVADTAADTLTIAAGTGITITTNAATDTLTITNSSSSVPTLITVANEATDISCFVGFFTAATGDLGPKTNANLTFNSNTGGLAATTFTGAVIGNVTGNVTGNADTATALLNARTIGGVSFNGTANITVATATGGFTVSGGDLALGANNITMTGSLGATAARVTKGWFTDVESTNMVTIGGVSLTTVAQTFQNKTITNSNNVLGGVTMTLGSDADGDMYYRASNVLTRLAKGTAGQLLKMNSGATAPSWSTGQFFPPTVNMATIFETAGRFTSIASGGTNTFGVNGLALTTTSTGSRVAGVQQIVVAGDIFSNTSMFTAVVDITTVGTAGFFFIGVGDVSTAAEITNPHYGFKIVYTAGPTGTLVGSQAEGGTESVTATLTTVEAGQVIYLCAIKNGNGVSVDYYYRLNGGDWNAGVNNTNNVPTTATAMWLTAQINNAATSTTNALTVQSYSLQR